MIKYLRHKEIDKSLWDQTIDISKNGIIYAYSWYLDIVSPGWDALVMDDYSAVMPLTWKSKIGLNYLIQPLFTQQISIYKTSLEKNLWHEFFKAIPQKYLYINLCFTSDSSELCDHYNSIKHRNLILSLNKSYNELKSNYSKSHSKNIRRAEKNDIEIKSCSQKEYIDFLKTEYQKILNRIQPEVYDLYLQIFLETIKHGSASCIGAYNKENLVAVSSTLNISSRIHNLMVASSNGKNLSALFLLIDSIIKKYSETNHIVDFGGSDIESIAYFFRGFGSMEENYYQLKHSSLVPKFLLKF